MCKPATLILIISLCFHSVVYGQQEQQGVIITESAYNIISEIGQSLVETERQKELKTLIISTLSLAKQLSPDKAKALLNEEFFTTALAELKLITKANQGVIESHLSNYH